MTFMNIVPNDIINVARVFWWVTTFICMWYMYSSLSKQLKHSLETYEIFNWNNWNIDMQHLKHGTWDMYHPSRVLGIT
jgi:hypothetical protein